MVSRFPLNLIGLIPRGLECEVVHKGHVAPGGQRVEVPQGERSKAFFLSRFKRRERYFVCTRYLYVNSEGYGLFMTWDGPL